MPLTSMPWRDPESTDVDQQVEERVCPNSGLQLEFLEGFLHQPCNCLRCMLLLPRLQTTEMVYLQPFISVV